MTGIDAIKSRLGSLSPTAMAKLPAAVQKLLSNDMPWLLNKIDSYEDLLDEMEARINGNSIRK